MRVKKIFINIFLNSRLASSPLWTNFHAVYCKSFRILGASAILAHFFWFLLRDFKKQLLIGHTYCVSETGHFEWVFLSPWAKIEKREQITLKPWEIWTNCKKCLIIGSKLCPALVPHHKKYICIPATSTGLYFLWPNIPNIGRYFACSFKTPIWIDK